MVLGVRKRPDPLDATTRVAGGDMTPRDEGPIITLGIITLCVFSYFVGLWGGLIQCSHRCYWCGASLEAK